VKVFDGVGVGVGVRTGRTTDGCLHEVIQYVDNTRHLGVILHHALQASGFLEYRLGVKWRVGYEGKTALGSELRS